MPRAIEERWIGIGFDVIDERLQAAGPDGQPIHDANGLPKMVDATTLVFILPMPDGQRVIRVPFQGDAKTELVRKLTGGIVIATPNGTTPPPI